MFDIVSFRGYFRQRFATFNLAAGAQQICPVAPTRALLVVSCAGGGPIALSMQPGVNNLTGIYSIPVNSQQELFWERHGLIVTQDWYVGTTGINNFVNVFELFWEPTGGR